MSVVKDKIVLCQIGLADFSIESVNQVPFYKRYSEFCRLFASKIPSVDFESCFAQPQENNAKKTIEWYFKPGTESPMKLSELKDLDIESYHSFVQQRNEIVNNIRLALNKANENDQKYLNAVLAGFEADYIDSITYSYDDHILMGIWGMRTKTGRQIDSVITEGVLDHRAYRVIYQIQGDGRVSPFSSINRRYGHILHGDKDIPHITPNEGSYFKEWVPDAPHGKEVKSDMVYIAVCEKEPKGSDSKTKHQVRFIVGEQGQTMGQTEYEKCSGERVLPNEIPLVTPKEGFRFVGWDKSPDGYVVNENVVFEAQYENIEAEKRCYEVRFDEGNHGVLHGQTIYEKRRNEKVLPSEVPDVEPERGYRFVGWDKNPNGYVVNEDVEFVAQYEEKEDEPHYEVRFDEGDHGKLHGQTIYEKRRNERVLPSEVPDAEPEEGYRFIGWDKNPSNHIVTEDVVFVAQYEEVKESWWSHFWGWGSGCLNWLLALLLAGLIGLLLWYLLSGYQRFNFCGCDCEETTNVPLGPDEPNKPDEPLVIYEEEPCGSVTQSGHDEGVVKPINMGQKSGSFMFNYNTYTVKDRITIYNGKEPKGTPIFQYQGGTQGDVSKQVSFNSSDGYISVVVEAIESGTSWYFIVNCPE